MLNHKGMNIACVDQCEMCSKVSVFSHRSTRSECEYECVCVCVFLCLSGLKPEFSLTMRGLTIFVGTKS